MKKNKYFDIVAIISIIFICMGFTSKIVANDTFYTIKIGKLILDNGIDMMDHFSFINNLPYTYPHWLYDVFINLIYQLGGFLGIYILNILTYIIIGLLLYSFSKKRTNNYLFSFIITIIVIGFLRIFITTRAQVFSFIIFIIEKYFIDKFLENGKKNNILIIIVLSIILVNIHLATWIFFFVLFLPPIASHYLSLIFKKIKKDDKDFSIGRIEFKTNKNTNKLFIIIFLCLLTGLLTPLHFTPYTYIFNQFLGGTLSYIQEYQNITITNCFSFYQFLFLILVLFLITKEKISLEDLFLLIGLIIMSLVAIRSFSYLLIIGMFVISNYLGKINKKLSTKTKNNMNYIFNKKSQLIIISISFIAIGTILFLFNNIKNEYYYYNSTYPIKATNFIKEELDTKNIKIFNDYSIGSYLLFNDIKVFIDSRSDLYTIPFNKKHDIFNDYIKVIDNFDYEKIFDYYHITHVLMKNDNMLIKILKRDINYKEIYKDKDFIILEKITN